VKKLLYCLILLFALQAAAAADRTSVALLDLQEKGVTAEEASAITDRIREELFKTGQFTVMDRSVMDKLLAERGLQMSGLVSSEGAVEAGKILGVDWIIVGSVSKVGNMFSISLRSIDVQTGVVLNIASSDYDGSIEGAARISSPAVVSKLVGTKPTKKVKDQTIKEKKSKTWLYVTGGVLVAGGVAAVVLAGGGGEDSSTPSNTGNIIIEVPSNP